MSNTDETKLAVVQQLETYSNGIVAFIVLQGLAYLFYFGSDRTFNCVVRASDYLPESLTVLFIVVSAIAIYAIQFCEKKKSDLLTEFDNLFVHIAHGKIVAVTLFGLLPASITFFYAVLAPAPHSCWS